ncbi:hypothetical protein [Massilia aquatica]|uniref:Uncharacterized protein n=1 Tax=Massilia aquatica TaxID=2609000 RepID=A0ABX0M9A8_9BURK|nr:hypothetical protein [Massilia aquatica]NHZ41598.1 hypothetical protein [Massilia aquatica]
MMTIHHGFFALRQTIDQFPPAGRIFTRPKIERGTIMDAEFVVVPSREVEGYSEESGGGIPYQIAGKDYQSWLEAPVVQDIIVYWLERHPGASLEELVDAVFHYDEYDAFKDA